MAFKDNLNLKKTEVIDRKACKAIAAKVDPLTSHCQNIW